MGRPAPTLRVYTVALLLVLAVLAGSCDGPRDSTATPPVNQVDNNSGSLGNHTVQTEPALAVYRDTAVNRDTVVVGWVDTNQAAGGLDELTSITRYGVLTNGGASFANQRWFEQRWFEPPPRSAATGNVDWIHWGDPSVAVDRSGNFYLGTLAQDDVSSPNLSRIAVARSAAPNVTFGTPSLIKGLMASGYQDRGLIAVDTSGGSSDGRVYVAWSEFADSCDIKPRVLFTRSTSTSPSLSFEDAKPLSPADAGNHGAMPAVGPNGDVYVVWGRFGRVLTSSNPCRFRTTEQSILFVRLPSGGDVSIPFITKTIVESGNLSPSPDDMVSVSPEIHIRARGAPSIAVDRSTGSRRGYLYVVYHASRDSSDRAEVFFTRSMDRGDSWSFPKSINRGTYVTSGADPTSSDNWQPSIAVSPDTGDISVVFYDRRNDPVNKAKIAVFRAVSTDGGDKWFNEQISPEFMPATGFDDLVPPDFFGDYNSAYSSGANFHYAWGDSRRICDPPAMALNPCTPSTPSGRSDLDVFYRTMPAQPQPMPSHTEVNPMQRVLRQLRTGMRHVGGEIVGGMSARSATAAIIRLDQPRRRRSTTFQDYAADLDKVSQAIRTILRDKAPVADRTPRLINTASFPASNARLRQIVTQGSLPIVGTQNGRYLLSFRLERTADGKTRVTVTALIIANALVDNPLGGRPVASSGVLEKEYLGAIAAAIPR